MIRRALLTGAGLCLLGAACAPGADEPLGQPTPPELATPVPASETQPAEPVIPMPPDEPGTFPPALPPSPSPTTPP